jgi:hypothetical protein
MKRSLFIVFGIVLSVSLFAFTSRHQQHQKQPDPLYYWYIVTYDGSTPMIEFQSPLSQSTVASVSTAYDCPGDDRTCKAGFTDPLTFNENEDPILEGTDGEVNFKETDPNK